MRSTILEFLIAGGIFALIGYGALAYAGRAPDLGGFLNQQPAPTSALRLLSESPLVQLDVPPVGAIWFAQSFDPQTLEVNGRITTVNVGQPLSFVAHLRRSMDVSKLSVRAYLDGRLLGSSRVDGSGSRELVGFTPQPFAVAGTWRYDVVDAAGWSSRPVRSRPAERVGQPAPP